MFERCYGIYNICYTSLYPIQQHILHTSHKSILPRSMSSINLQIRPRHKSTRITDQKHRSPPIILWLTQFPQHVLCRPCLPPFRVQLEQFFDHVGHDIAWRDGVDAYAVVGTPLGG